jgi:hypothetical protein
MYAVFRKGPVFGFKRLHGFLTSPANDVVLSIYRDVKHWRDFLTSEDLRPKTDLLALVMQTLADKVCSDEVVLLAQQIEVVIPTACPEFKGKLTEQCTAILMGIDVPRNRFNRGV